MLSPIQQLARYGNAAVQENFFPRADQPANWVLDGIGGLVDVGASTTDLASEVVPTSAKRLRGALGSADDVLGPASSVFDAYDFATGVHDLQSGDDNIAAISQLLDSGSSLGGTMVETMAPRFAAPVDAVVGGVDGATDLVEAVRNHDGEKGITAGLKLGGSALTAAGLYAGGPATPVGAGLIVAGSATHLGASAYENRREIGALWENGWNLAGAGLKQGYDLGGDLMQVGADVAGDLTQTGLHQAGVWADSGADMAGDVLAQGADLAGGATSSFLTEHGAPEVVGQWTGQGISAAGHAADAGLDLAGDVVSAGADVAGSVVNTGLDLAGAGLNYGADAIGSAVGSVATSIGNLNPFK